MGIRDWFRGEKQSAVNPAILAISPANAVFTQRNYEDFVVEGYQTNPYVYAAIRLRGMLLGSLFLQVIRIASDGSKQVLLQHPLLDLMRRPNPMKGGSDFLSDQMVYKDISGNSYIEKVGFLDRPEELYNLRPDKVEILTGDSVNPVRGYQYGRTSKVFFEAERILHRKYLDPRNDWYGQSPLQAGGQSVDLSNEGRKWNISLLQNQAKPSGVLSAPGALNDKSYNRLQKLINKRLSGGVAAGRPLLAEGGLKWEQMGLSPTDMDWLEGQKLAAVESLVPLNVPPELIGISEAKTYGTFREALRSVWLNGVLPEAESLMSDLNNWLTPGFGDDIRLWFDKDKIEVLSEDRKVMFDMNVAATWRTVNEQREADGKAPIDGGDVVLINSSQIPLGSPVPEEKGIKAIGINHDDEKVQYWKTIDKAREDAVPGAKRFAESILDQEALRVAAAIDNSLGVDAAIRAGIDAVDDSAENWKEFIDTVYFEVGERFAANVFDRVEKQSPVEIQTKGDFNTWRAFVRDYIAKISADKIKLLTDTSRQDVRAVLLQGIDEQLSIPQIADLMRDVLQEGANVRATRIARTEIIAASNAGSQAGAAATGLNLVKTWLPTQDTRTRNGFNSNRNHIDVTDSMRGVSMDQPYTVSGQKLMFPGDTSLGASPDNIINCRCSEIYDTVTVDGVQEIVT